MKEYLFLFRGGDDATVHQSPGEWQAHMQKWMEWMGAIQQRGLLIHAQPLGKTGKQITGPRKHMEEGPFMEGDDMVGGFLMCNADNYETAVEIAKGCPILEFIDGRVEVREIQEIRL